MTYGTHPNGLRYAVRQSGKAVAYCALHIQCGTRNEEGFHGGIAHFTEHTIFKGTRHRNAASISSRLDRLGGELNAYTTKEEIVLHATVLREDLGKALDLILELATEATFPDTEIEIERGVVIDEIISYKDNPAEDIYDTFDEKLFQGHPLGGRILGTRKSVGKITPEELRRFYATYFTPERMALTVVADADEKRLERMVRRKVEKIPGTSPGMTVKEDGMTAAAGTAKAAAGTAKAATGTATAAAGTAKAVTGTAKAAARTATAVTGTATAAAGTATAVTGTATAAAGTAKDGAACHPELVSGSERVSPHVFTETVNKRNHEANAIIGGPAPSLYDGKDRITAALLINLLGGPASNSILGSILREKNGWVYSVECSYTQYSDTGIYAIAFGCDKPHLGKCLACINRELTRLMEKPLTETRLKAARKQFLGQLAIASDNGEAQCLSMGKSLLSFGHIPSTEENRALIEAVTAEDIQEMSRRLFDSGTLSTLIFL